MMNDLERKKILNFLQWNDKNGYYTDEICDLEEVPRLTYEDSIKYFFGVLNGDFYYKISDNIFELDYEEVVNKAKENNIYFKTLDRLELLLSNKADNKLYKKLLY